MFVDVPLFELQNTILNGVLLLQTKFARSPYCHCLMQEVKRVKTWVTVTVHSKAHKIPFLT